MDIDLYYEECGEGFPLILLHGNGESHVYFENQVKFFSTHYRVITVDTRGHGKSPRGDAPFTLAQFADDLYFFMSMHGIMKAHLLGFSDGGNIALLFALKHPEMIHKLILNGADLTTSGVKTHVQLPIELGYRLTSLISRFDKKAVMKAEMLGLMVGQPDIRPEELKSLNMPTLVIVGTRDMIRNSHSELIARSIPSAEFVRIPGTHFIAAENSAAFNQSVSDFLRDD